MNLNNYQPKPIVHIATDEKFINTAYDIYEKALPGKNQFLIFLDDSQSKVKHISSSKNHLFFNLNENYTDAVQSILNSAKVVVFHSLVEFQAKIILRLNDFDLTKVWSVFGKELYENPKLYKTELYGNITQKKYFGLKHRIKQPVKSFILNLLQNKDYPKSVKAALKKIDIVSILMKEEYDLYNELSILKEDTTQLKFTYFPINLMIKENDEIVNSNNIMIGNSATFTNNHLDVFDLLSKMNLPDNKIIVPLSYGFKNYADDIIQAGKTLFGENFSPITEFLPYDQYDEIVSSCGIVIMNHYRQQAVGNILMTLYKGAKVYLRNSNILFRYFKRIGCYIYSIDDDLQNRNPEAFKLLNPEQVEKNRYVLRSEIELDKICEEIRNKLQPTLS